MTRQRTIADRLPNLPSKPFPFDLEALEAAHKRHWARLERVGMDLNRVAELLEASHG